MVAPVLLSPIMLRLLCAVAALALLHASAALAVSHQSHLSSDPRVKEARWLVENKRFDESLNILRALPTDHPDKIDILFLTGLAATRLSERVKDSDRRAALLNEAVAAFHAILAERPALTRVRLELARAFFLAGDDSLSREHFERVLAGNPPPAMAANIQRFLHTIRARRRWSSYLSVNIRESDNINSGTDTEVIYIFDLPFVVDEESRPRSGTGLSLGVGGEYQYPLAERWRWRFGVDVSRLEYAGHDLDGDYLQLRSGPRYLVSRRSEVGLQVFERRRWLAGDRYSREHGLLLDARHRLTAKLGFNGRASLGETDYRNASSRDAKEREYTLGAAYLFSPLVEGSASLGETRVRIEDGTRNSGRNVRLGLGVVLPKGWTVGGNYEWVRQRYGYDAPFSTERRVDRLRTAHLFVLNRQLTLFGFSPQLIATREKQKSNSALANYRRTRYELRFVRQF